MEDKYFFSEIQEFINNNFDENSYNAIKYFLKFIMKNYKFMTINEYNNEYADKFFFTFLPKHISMFDDCLINDIVNSVNSFSIYLKENYNIDINIRTEDDIIEIKRLCSIKREFDRFLNNPVLSYSPLIIDFQRYRNRALKSQIQSFFQNKDKGYFTIEDIFSNTAVIVRKIYTEKFMKIILDKQIVQCIKPKDILYMSVKQSPFFSWEIENVFKYYPSAAINYLKREVYK